MYLWTCPRRCLQFLVVAFMAVSIPAQAASITEFIDFSLRDARGTLLLPGRLYVPPEAMSDSTTARPFMLFLPGGASNGTDNHLQIDYMPNALLAEAKRRAAFLYAPQAPSGWSSQAISDRVMTMIDRAVGEQPIDFHRLYITGYSNGGGGTWNMLSRYDGRFAAALTISSVVPASDFVAAKLIDTPIWTFHARDDTTESVSNTRNVINKILTAAHAPLPSFPAPGNTADYMVSNPMLDLHRQFDALAHQQRNVTDFFLSNANLDLLYYESANGGHTSLLGVYDVPLVYDWLFSHALAVPEPASVAMLLIGTVPLLKLTRGRRSLAVRFLN